MVSVEGFPALEMTANALPVLGCFKEHVFMAVGDPGFNVSTRPVLSKCLFWTLSLAEQADGCL